MWGYEFRKGKEPIFTLWTTGEQKTIRLFTREKSVEQADIMGQVTHVTPVHGVAQIEIGPDISYVRGTTRVIE